VGDSGRLIALGPVLGHELELDAALRLLRARRSVRREQTLVTGNVGDGDAS